MSPRIFILPFMEPESLESSIGWTGVTRATGRPLLVITKPLGSTWSSIQKHFALNSVALIVRFMIVTARPFYHATTERAGKRSGPSALFAVAALSERRNIRKERPASGARRYSLR